jgi:hypothetical protein
MKYLIFTDARDSGVRQWRNTFWQKHPQGPVPLSVLLGELVKRFHHEVADTTDDPEMARRFKEIAQATVYRIDDKGLVHPNPMVEI